LPPNKNRIKTFYAVFKSKLALPFLGIILFSILNWHCTKVDITSIGSGLIPAVDNVNTFDSSYPVIANSFDSILLKQVCTTIYPQEDYALGSINNDPLFGTTKGTIFTEMKPEFFPFSWRIPSGSTVTLDSVVMCLSYRGAYGDSTKQQKVDVFELTNSVNFAPDSNSCSTYSFSTLLGSATFTPERLKDSVKVKPDTTTGELRIKLSNTFGQRLLSQDSSTAFSSDTTFKKFLKGFAIVPNTAFGGNAITYFGMFDNNTKLNVYFHYRPAASNKDSSILATFKTTLGLTATANNITRNHSGSAVASWVAGGPRPSGDSLIYIQTTPGTYAEIKIPVLSTLSNRIIHKAELIIDQVYAPPSDPDKYFYPPNYVYLDLKDTGTTYRNIPCDLNATSGRPDLENFGGVRKTVKDKFGNDITRYTFDISRYVQKIVTTHRINGTLRLRAPDYISTAFGYLDDCGFFSPILNYPINDPVLGRVKLGGGNNTNYPMKLRVIFSKL